MGTQRKVGTSLNLERQRRLDELVAAEPFACPSTVLALSLDMLYEAWRRAGGDLKAVLRKSGMPGKPLEGAA